MRKALILTVVWSPERGMFLYFVDHGRNLNINDVISHLKSFNALLEMRIDQEYPAEELDFILNVAGISRPGE